MVASSSHGDILASSQLSLGLRDRRQLGHDAGISIVSVRRSLHICQHMLTTQGLCEPSRSWKDAAYREVHRASETQMRVVTGCETIEADH